MPQMQYPGFTLRAGAKPNTVEVIDARNNRVAFVLEHVSVKDVDTETNYGNTIIELTIEGVLGIVEPGEVSH